MIPNRNIVDRLVSSSRVTVKAVTTVWNATPVRTAGGIASSAWVSSRAPNATVTTQYTLDSVTDTLFIQNPPNEGKLVSGKVVTLDGAPLDFTGLNGFDIPASVTVAASGDAAVGQGFAALSDGTSTKLYGLDLADGTATAVGDLGGVILQGLAVQNDLGGAPVVALSADAMPSTIDEARRAGFLGYLTKPLDVAAFLRTLDGALAGHVKSRG